MRFKAIAVLLLVVVSLVPAFALFQYLQRVIRPRESGRRFFTWLLLVLLLVFVYTFLLVFLIQLLFPQA